MSFVVLCSECGRSFRGPTEMSANVKYNIHECGPVTELDIETAANKIAAKMVSRQDEFSNRPASALALAIREATDNCGLPESNLGDVFRIALARVTEALAESED